MVHIEAKSAHDQICPFYREAPTVAEMDSSSDMMLVVNRSKERMNKFRKKTANGDISSKENYYECCVFELQGVPKIAFQDDVTRNTSLHDVNLNEVRELVLALMGKKINIPKYFKLNNAPFVRRIVHLHIADVPAATNPNTMLSKGGPQALLAGLSLGGVKCIRVDKEVDEQGLLPYKLLTVPYSKHHELALTAVETSTSTSATQSGAGAGASAGGNSGASANGVVGSVSSVSVAQTEEQQAYHTLLPYVLSPAQLHLWSYPTDKLLTIGHTDSHSTVAEAVSGVGGSDSSIVDDEQPAKRARIDPSVDTTTTTTADSASVVSKGVTHGAEYLPTLTEAQQVLSTLSTNTDWVTTNTTTTTNTTNTLLIAAIDCEMCETSQGSELTRVSVLTFEGIVVFDALVKPKHAITNYQTQYSGITEEILRDVNVTLQQVQVALLRLISPATLLVGHSLDSDLRALRIVHTACVDTALLYPHPRGFPMRLKLKKLAEDYLQLRIQGNTAKGHDSTEDAKAALQLALLKVANGPLFGVKNPDQQRFALMSVLDPVSTKSVLVWTGEGGKSSGSGVGVGGGVVKEVSEVVVAEGSGGSASVAATTTTVVADTTTTTNSYGADSCVGGNARTVCVENNSAAIAALYAQLSSPADSQTYTVSTTEDKSLGPISSWVSNPRAAGSDVKAIQVPKKSYLFARLEHSSGVESDSFPAELNKQIESIRATINAADAECGQSPGTLLLVTAQESLSHVLALIQRKRILSKATMAAAMWSADDELRLRELRKHNLAYMTTAIV